MNSPTQNVFISYARQDDGLRDELVKHLAVLRQQGLISDWHDRQIRAGQSWEAEIERNIQIADLVLLLVSPDFLSSHFCLSVELPLAMDLMQRRPGVKVIPIILRPCDWEHSPLSRFQVLPEGGVPITVWKTKDDAFTNVVKGLRAALSKQSISEVTLRPVATYRTTMSDIISRARSGHPNDIDFIMSQVEETESSANSQSLDFVLSLVSMPIGRNRILYYLAHGTDKQRLAAGLYFKVKCFSPSVLRPPNQAFTI